MKTAHGAPLTHEHPFKIASSNSEWLIGSVSTERGSIRAMDHAFCEACHTRNPYVIEDRTSGDYICDCGTVFPDKVIEESVPRMGLIRNCRLFVSKPVRKLQPIEQLLKKQGKKSQCFREIMRLAGMMNLDASPTLKAMEYLCTAWSLANKNNHSAMSAACLYWGCKDYHLSYRFHEFENLLDLPNPAHGKGFRFCVSWLDRQIHTDTLVTSMKTLSVQ